MNWFIKLRILFAVGKVYPLWGLWYLINLLKIYLISLAPDLVGYGLVTKASNFIKCVTVSNEVNQTINVTAAFRYLYESELISDYTGSSCINLDKLRNVLPFHYIIIDYVNKETKLEKKIIGLHDKNYYYLNADLSRVAQINFETIHLDIN